MAMCNKKTNGMKADERAKAQSECMKATDARELPNYGRVTLLSTRPH